MNVKLPKPALRGGRRGACAKTVAGLRTVLELLAVGPKPSGAMIAEAVEKEEFGDAPEPGLCCCMLCGIAAAWPSSRGMPAGLALIVLSPASSDGLMLPALCGKITSTE